MECGFRLQPSQICGDGCLTDDPKLIDQSCPVKPCVIEKRLDHGSQCEHHVCDKLRERMVSFEDVRQKFGAEIPQEDRICSILPYESMV